MYRFTASPSAVEQTVHHLSADGRQLFLVYITEHEQESLSRFKPETLHLLLEKYSTCISEGVPDGSDALYQRLADGLGLPPRRAKLMMGSLRKLFTNHLVLTEGMEPLCSNLTCERGGNRLSVRAGMVEIGEVEEVAPEAEAPGSPADQDGQNGEPHTDEVQEEEHKDDVQEEEHKSKVQEEEHKSDPTPPWWNLSPPVVVVLLLLLAAVSFFVTLLLTGRISLGAS